MQDLILDREEITLLFGQNGELQETPADNDWQRLLVALQELADETTGEIEIPPRIAEKMRWHAFESGNHERETFLKSIFTRSMGRRLGR